jgi:hypothetical protein
MSEEIERYEHGKRLSRKIADADRLRARLLGDAQPFTDPPPGWRARQVPAPAEPIDDAVKALIDRTRAPRILSCDELATEWGTLCPYWTARGEIVAAVEFAGGTQFDHGEARTAIKPTRKGDAAKLAKAVRLATELAEILRDPAVARAVAAHPERALDDRLAGVRLADAMEAIAAASGLPGAIEFIREGAVAPEIGTFERAFASRMALAFERLTGKRPGKGAGPFMAFLNAAGETAGVGADWENLARKVLSS